MSAEQPLLDEICADPDAIAPRLIYADWLEEHGNPLSELIRVQCELFELDSFEDPYHELKARERELLPSFQEQTAGIERFNIQLRFRRGFVEEFTTHYGRTPKNLESAFKAFPLLQSAHLVGNSDAISQVIDAPFLRRIRELHFSTLSDSCVETLARSRTLTELRVLHFNRVLLAKYISRWRKSRVWSGLKQLRLLNSHIGDTGLRTLLGAKSVSSLEDLNLKRNLLESSISHLAGSKVIQGLRRLNLSQNAIQSRGVAELASAEGLAQLERLSLSRCQLDDEALHTISRCPLLRNLTHLDVSENAVEQGLDLISESSYLRELRFLHLYCARVQSGQLARFAESPNSNHLAWLDLGNNALTDADARVLASNPKFATLRYLSLTGNRLTDEGAIMLAESESLRDLRQLNLNRNWIGTAGMEAIAKEGRWPKIRDLGLTGNPGNSENMKQRLARKYGKRLWL